MNARYQLMVCPKYQYRILHNEVAEFTERESRLLCQHKYGIAALELNIQSAHIISVIYFMMVKALL